MRTRVELGETTVRISLPQSAGATPMLHFIAKEIPYDKIAAVETRGVLFGNAMAPVLLRATRLLLKNGEHVRLGNVNEDNVDAALPFPEIGAKIAQRAGVEVVDAGTVRRSIEKPVLKFFGRKTPAESQPALDRDRDRRDQHPAFARHEVSDCGHGRADRGRHRHRRVHRATRLVRDHRHIGSGRQALRVWLNMRCNGEDATGACRLRFSWRTR